MGENEFNKSFEADIEYTIVVKNIDDILKEIPVANTDDRLLYESIITNIEKTASEYIKNDKIAQLPSIGCLRKNPLKKVMQSNYDNFRIARKNMTKQQYKDHVSSFINSAKEDLAKEERDKLYFKRIRSNNKKKYDKLYKTLGKAYAEMFIYSIYFMTDVPFDQDVQDAYDNLNK